jgi:hypothetical protein
MVEKGQTSIFLYMYGWFIRIYRGWLRTGLLFRKNQIIKTRTSISKKLLDQNIT